MFKYLTIICLLTCLVGAGFTVPANLETLKDLENSKRISTIISTNGRYAVYIAAGMLAGFVGFGLIAAAVESYCLTLFVGMCLSLFTLGFSFATVYTIFALEKFIWFNCLELGLSFIACLFVLFFAGMLKGRKESRSSASVQPLVVDKSHLSNKRETVVKEPKSKSKIRKVIPIIVPVKIASVPKPEPKREPVPVPEIEPLPVEETMHTMAIEDEAEEEREVHVEPEVEQAKEAAPEPEPEQELEDVHLVEEAKEEPEADNKPEGAAEEEPHDLAMPSNEGELETRPDNGRYRDDR